MSYEWLRFVDLDRIATDEEREKLMALNVTNSFVGYYDRWMIRFETFQLRDIIFSYAASLDNLNMIRFVSNIGGKNQLPTDTFCASMIWMANKYDTRCLLVDMGITCDANDLKYFTDSRNAARLGAIVAMGAIRSRLRREREREMGGWKDISRIIGRLIWESRKYYLSEESPTFEKN